MISLKIEGKDVKVFPAGEPGRPVVYLNTFAKEGERVRRQLEKMKAPDCTLVAIGNLDWNHDMAPWDIPPISKNDTPCTGGADDFLQVLLEQILPEAEKNVEGEPAWRGITGYSLAGLFAIYSLYRTDVFSRAATMSGSLWFPDLKEYIFSHEMKAKPDAVYFSLGEKESKTKNPYLKTVQENTDEIQKFYAGKGIDSVFVLNPGNHYVNAFKRTAAGIDWILER
ncbi:MAG: alpha/beta hydrolase [Oscillospiraceae bacterium]|nr:alpha/beta hydrolase [Oscillospiraceae bacterium]